VIIVGYSDAEVRSKMNVSLSLAQHCLRDKQRHMYILQIVINTVSIIKAVLESNPFI